MTIPNLISLIRIAMAAVLPWVDPTWRLWVFVIAAASDWLDGFLAHVMNSRSELGRILDPLADKLLAASAIGTLISIGEIQWWHAVLALMRDIAVALGAIVSAIRRNWKTMSALKPSLVGKITTVCLFFWVVALFAKAPESIQLPLFSLTAGFSCATAVQYAWRFAQARSELRSGMP